MKKLVKLIIRKIEKKVVEANDWWHIPGADEEFFYIAPHIYKGKQIELPDGTIISKGDLLAEIHVDNLKADRMEDVKSRDVFRILRNEFDCLADAVLEDERFKEIKAYHGKTLFFNLLKRQGFTILEVKLTPSVFLISIWEHVLRKVFAKRVSKRKKSFQGVKEFWATKDDMINRKYKERHTKK